MTNQGVKLLNEIAIDHREAEWGVVKNAHTSEIEGCDEDVYLNGVWLYFCPTIGTDEIDKVRVGLEPAYTLPAYDGTEIFEFYKL